MSDDEHGGGKGRPPKGTQFPKGRSGNPSGRPRGSKNRKTILRKLAQERHRATREGKEVTLPTVELLFRMINRKAVAGNLTAKKALDRYRNRFSRHDDDRSGGFTVVPEPLSMEEWDRFAEAQRARMEYDKGHHPIYDDD